MGNNNISKKRILIYLSFLFVLLFLVLLISIWYNTPVLKLAITVEDDFSAGTWLKAPEGLDLRVQFPGAYLFELYSDGRINLQYGGRHASYRIGNHPYLFVSCDTYTARLSKKQKEEILDLADQVNSQNLQYDPTLSGYIVCEFSEVNMVQMYYKGKNSNWRYLVGPAGTEDELTLLLQSYFPDIETGIPGYFVRDIVLPF